MDLCGYPNGLTRRGLEPRSPCAVVDLTPSSWVPAPLWLSVAWGLLGILRTDATPGVGPVGRSHNQRKRRSPRSPRVLSGLRLCQRKTGGAGARSLDEW